MGRAAILPAKLVCKRGEVGPQSMDCSQHILAVDVGSSSVRCSFYKVTGTFVKGTGVSFAHAFATTRDGGATLDADELCELVFRAIDEALGRSGERMGKIAGVALSTFWHSVLRVDRRGRPTTPIFTWADRRTADAAGELRERLDEAAVHRRTGCVLHSSYYAGEDLVVESLPSGGV